MLNTLLAFENLNPMDWTAIKPALHFLWQGLLAIFVVIGLIIIAVKVTALCIQKAEESKKRREEEKANQDTPDKSI
ncbi:MAG: hypothetical protein IJ317_06080 [Clostridia bacterium]|nr:hypothetical protein [Clostridia bacterium]